MRREEGRGEVERLTNKESSDASLVLSMSSPLLKTEEHVAHLRRPGGNTTMTTLTTAPPGATVKPQNNC